MCMFNDVTVREYQFKTTQWMQGKNFDGHGPLGPMLITLDEVNNIFHPKMNSLKPSIPIIHSRR